VDSVQKIISVIGVARGGALGARAPPPQGGEKFFVGGANLQGKVVSAPPVRECTPEAEQEFIFSGNWGDLDLGRGYLGSFSVFEGDD